MRMSYGLPRTDISENTMTSMIDVVFLLLIFFVCAAAGQIPERLLPTPLAAQGAVPSATVVQNERKADRDEIWIHLHGGPDGRTRVELNGRDLAGFDALRETLRVLADLQPENPVILDIEPVVPAGDVVRVYDVCRAVHFRTVNFNVHPDRLPAHP